MKRVTAVFLVLLGATITIGFQATSEWIKFKPPNGLFAVLMPTQPTEQKETKPSPHGPYTTNLVQSKGNGEVFMAGWVEYDPKYIFDAQEELESNRDNFAKAVNGTVRNTTKITFEGNPGIEFDGTTPKFSFKSRVYLIGKIPYMLVVAFPSGGDASPNINKFLFSFELPPR